MQNTQRIGRWAVLALIATVAVGAWGCRRGRPAVANGQLNPRYERQLIQIAARDTRCPPGQLSISLLAQGQPAVYSVMGCQQPREYMLRCGRRGRRCAWRPVTPLAQTAAANIQCAAPQIQVQPTQMPNVRYATGCGRQAPFTISCNTVTCGWAVSGPIEGAGPAVAAQQPQVAVQAAQPGQPNGAAAGENLQNQLMTQREAILSCLDNAAGLALTLRWTAEGQVFLEIPPELSNTAAEGCIQAAVGVLRVQAAQPGQITVQLQ